MAVRSQKTTIVTTPPANRAWVHIDATDQVLGRLATKIATILMGKHKPNYTPHVDTGDFVVVTNCSGIRVTGRKLQQETVQRYTGYPSGLKQISKEIVHRERPELLLRLAVRRMLPRNALARRMLLKLKAYKGSEHPHQAQLPAPVAM